MHDVKALIGAALVALALTLGLAGVGNRPAPVAPLGLSPVDVSDGLAKAGLSICTVDEDKAPGMLSGCEDSGGKF